MQMRPPPPAAGPSPAGVGPGLDLVLRQMPACLWSTDLELRVTSSMGTGLASLGLEHGQLVGTTVDEFVAGTESRSLEYHRRALAGETIDYEVDVGAVRWRAHVEPLRDEGGTIVGTMGLALDVTAETEALEALRETETRNRVLIEQIPVVTYREEVEAPNRTVFISPQVEAFFGYTTAEWLEHSGVLWYSLVHPDDYERVVAENDRTNETGETFDIEYRIVARDGRVVWIHDESRLIRDEDGRPIFWQGVYVDITERRRAEESLRKAFERERDAAERLRGLDNMKNTFLAAVSHDLRTPLSAILGIALTLDRNEVELTWTETRELLHGLAGNARKLERLLSDLLDLDRLSRGIIEPNRRPTDLTALVHQVVDAPDVAPRHSVAVDGETVVAEIDPAQVERIIENLVSNAARHTPEGTPIAVRVEGVDGGALVVVDDDGPGIPEPQRESIFEAFEQVTGRNPHSPGVGVGLSLVARFAELHGGRAWVEPRPGGGSSFRVFLPGAAEGSPAGS